jgi:hypothetical protein
MSSFDSQLQERIARYLSGLGDLRELYEWFAPNAWNADKRFSPSVAANVHEIELLFAEHQRGDRSEEEMRSALSALTSKDSVVAGQGVLWVHVSTSNMPGNQGSALRIHAGALPIFDSRPESRWATLRRGKQNT